MRSLLEEVERERATLLCVGSHGNRRVPGILFDYVGTTMLHEAPSAVLIARQPGEPESFPRSIVVGVDGSSSAAAAHAAAATVAQRFDAALTSLTATDAADVDVDAARGEVPDLLVVNEKPVDALLAAASSADLLVVGSRGLHGIRALGSVSERVAHRAGCSVLVVRTPVASVRG